MAGLPIYTEPGSMSGLVTLFFWKGKTLRTAIEKKAQTAPSPAETSVDSVSRVLEIALNSLDDSKAENIVSIDIQGKSPLADYMIIASSRSHRHVADASVHLLLTRTRAGHRALRD